ncbi:MAG: secondary thiamine-phosphate synthase enzyme YjbQ [Verrucomicrobia bacterium]|nr:secondary thiamine-phosphate synthase enzyme YjbQ [Verrucomicrobiota bacterium]
MRLLPVVKSAPTLCYRPAKEKPGFAAGSHQEPRRTEPRGSPGKPSRVQGLREKRPDLLDRTGPRPHTGFVKTHQEEIHLQTAGHRDIHDLTGKVAAIVRRSGVETGLVHVFNVGSTACVGTIEFEPGLERDIGELLDRLIPPSRSYGHEQAWHDGNGHSHLQATLIGPDLTVPVTGGRLRLGTWQQIFHLECYVDPRARSIVVTVSGQP